MRAHIITALLDPLDDFRGVLADQAVEQVRGREFQLVEHAEDARHSDAQAVIPPRIIALCLRTSALRRVGPPAGQKSKPLDIQRDVECEPLAVRPTVVGPLFNG